MEQYDKQKAIKAQKEYSETTRNPHFAPHDGNCWACRMNIYDKKTKGDHEHGITVEKAGNQLITGCPHCHRSYCD